jgi:hypothetical protein
MAVGRGRRLMSVLATAGAIMALGAVVASGASARSWKIAGTALSGSESISCKTNTGFTLSTKIGEVNVVMKFAGVNCIGSSKITAPSSDSGTLEFTGVTVEKPKNCSVSEGKITTNPITTELLEPSADKTNGFDLFRPTTGEEFVTIHITGSLCAVAGNYPLKGLFAGKGNSWGTEVVEQPLAFSPATETLTGKKITTGGEAMTLEGTMLVKLAGTNVGKVFGAA